MILSILVLWPASSVYAQETADYYRQNCMSCHTIGGGRMTGPDLKNVAERRDREWLLRFIIDPKGMIDRGDPQAVELLQEYRGVVMPTAPGMSRSRAEALLDLIAAESKLEKSQFAGVQLSDRAFTERDIELGRELFLGRKPFTNGGPSCISCHSVTSVGGLGGGRLGPDLTTVFERYEGRKTLATWLTAPATPIMQSVYKAQPLDAEEVLPLVAYFQHTLQRSPEDPATARLTFVLIGLGGTLLLLGLFDVAWGSRFRAVRRTLVQRKRLELIDEQ
jgi:mono/diheme cytochrome c family protein